MQLVVIVDGGCVQDILTDGPTEVVLRDFDNIREGGADETFPVTVEPTIVEDIFNECEDV